MKITLVTVGKIKERYFEDAIREYAKRLSRYCKLDIIQVADELPPRAPPFQKLLPVGLCEEGRPCGEAG